MVSGIKTERTAGGGACSTAETKKPRLGRACKYALRFQLTVRALHGNNGDPQMLRQRPLGGKPRPGGQSTAENVRPDPAAQVFIEGERTPFLHGVSQHSGTSRMGWEKRPGKGDPAGAE